MSLNTITDMFTGIIEELGQVVKATSRCGLGQTSPNPILSTLKNFRALYEARVKEGQPFQPTFDIQKALSTASQIAERIRRWLVQNG